MSVFACWLGIQCEAFPGRLPSEILAERARLPEGLLDEVLDSLAYRRALAANQADAPGWETSPMRQLATDIELELAAEEIAAQGDHGG